MKPVKSTSRSGKPPTVRVVRKSELDAVMATALDGSLQPSSDVFSQGDHPPKQARSRETMTRLLDAAELVLAESGLDAATVPVIAERAGVSVGIVYQRFDDKDMLLRAVYERFFARVRERNRINLGVAGAMTIPLARMARLLVRGMVEGYRRHRGILRALLRYAHTHPDPEFRQAAYDLNQEGAKVIASLLLRHRDEIQHPEPELAIELGLLMIATVLRALVLEDEPRSLGLRTPEDIDQELVRMFFSYVGIDMPEDQPPPHRRGSRGRSDDELARMIAGDLE